ncbi:MAG: sel1 repeat family protein [Alphaproteobacteria bacterium]|nr:sel1 repeat family protein [Alphaproteobacteria bacterium]
MFKKTFRVFVFWTAVLAVLIYTIKQFPDRSVEAETAYLRGDYVLAQKFWRKMARLGDATAQYNLGALYATGNGVDVDEEKAHKWFLTAAKNGNAAAKFEVGKTFETGAGVAPSAATGLKWIIASAEDGYAPAQVDLGLKYLNGTGVEKDLAAANFWLARAAGSGGDPPIQILKSDATP